MLPYASKSPRPSSCVAVSSHSASFHICGCLAQARQLPGTPQPGVPHPPHPPHHLAMDRPTCPSFPLTAKVTEAKAQLFQWSATQLCHNKGRGTLPTAAQTPPQHLRQAADAPPHLPRAPQSARSLRAQLRSCVMVSSACHTPLRKKSFCSCCCVGPSKAAALHTSPSPSLPFSKGPGHQPTCQPLSQAPKVTEPQLCSCVTVSSQTGSCLAPLEFS